MREALQALPSSLDKIFQATLAQIRRQSETNVNLAIKTMEWIFLAKRLLLVEDLCQGLFVRPTELSLDEDGYYLLEDMVDACSGLVILDEADKAIHFINFTVRVPSQQSR